MWKTGSFGRDLETLVINTYTWEYANVCDLFQEHPVYTRSPVLSRICTTNTMVLCTVLYELLPLQSLSFIPHSSTVSYLLQLHVHIIQHSIQSDAPYLFLSPPDNVSLRLFIFALSWILECLYKFDIFEMCKSSSQIERPSFRISYLFLLYCQEI